MVRRVLDPSLDLAQEFAARCVHTARDQSRVIGRLRNMLFLQSCQFSANFMLKKLKAILQAVTFSRTDY